MVSLNGETISALRERLIEAIDENKGNIDELVDQILKRLKEPECNSEERIALVNTLLIGIDIACICEKEATAQDLAKKAAENNIKEEDFEEVIKATENDDEEEVDVSAPPVPSSSPLNRLKRFRQDSIRKLKDAKRRIDLKRRISPERKAQMRAGVLTILRTANQARTVIVDSVANDTGKIVNSLSYYATEGATRGAIEGTAKGAEAVVARYHCCPECNCLPSCSTQ